jgi:hypothetical protein
MQEMAYMNIERDRRVTEIVHHFFLALLTFRQQRDKYRQGGLQFSDLNKLVDDRGESILFFLKESCHNLFRRRSSFVSEKEQLFDLTIGSIFHLAMKMREDLYQLEIYGPKYLDLMKKVSGSLEQDHLLHQFREIISRAETSFKEGMEEIDILAADIFRQFKNLLVEYRDNGLLIRFFLEEEGLLMKVLGDHALKDLFHIMYGSDEVQPLRIAGESYFESAYYAQSVKAFSRALEKSPGDPELQFKINLSQGMDQFYTFAPHQALKSFDRCLALSEKVDFLKPYRTMIHRVCQKIQEELPGRRKNDQHRDLIKKAKSLQQQLATLPPLPSADISP